MGSKKVREILPNPVFPPLYKNVGIYCRISSRLQEQFNSMSNQASFFVQMVSKRVDWKLVDIYLDFRNGETTDKRPEFQRMLNDAKDKKLDMILNKSISRFSCNTADTVSALRELKEAGVTVIFDEESINTEQDSEFIISILSGFAEAENRSRSENQNWAIRKRLQDGTSTIYSRACFGYEKDDNGELIINYTQGKIVQDIFRMYLDGNSVVGIVTELEKKGIKSPTGKDKWCKRTIETMLSNEKYIGDALVFKTYTVHSPSYKRIINKDHSHEQFLLNESHPALISKEIFDAVQKEKEHRSNVIVDEIGVHRKSTHYSSKNNKK